MIINESNTAKKPDSDGCFLLQDTPKKDSEITGSSPESASNGMNLREIRIHEDAVSEIFWQRWIACYMLYDWNFHHAETSYCNNKCMWTDRVYNRLEGRAIEEDESLEELMTDTFNHILLNEVEDFIQTHMRVWKCDRSTVEYQIAKAMAWIF